MRTNNGTEYESNEFNDYCREAGIKRESTIAYTPEQNGVAEKIIEPSLKLPVPCYRSKVFKISYGEKLPTLSCMFKIGAHIKLWTPKLLRNLHR